MYRDSGELRGRQRVSLRCLRRCAVAYAIPSYHTSRIIILCSIPWLILFFVTRPGPHWEKEPPKCSSIGQIVSKATKYGTCIITRVKNSAEWIPEWVEYHKMLEIDRIFVFDDCSTDDGATEAILKYYESLGMINAFFDPPMNPCDLYDRKPAEGPLLDSLFQLAKAQGCDWIGSIDVDEYINFIDESDARLGFKSYLSRSLLPYVRLTWYIISGEGHIEKQPGLTIETYKVGQMENQHSKLFLRGQMSNVWNISHFPWDVQPYLNCLFWDMRRMISWGDDLETVSKNGIPMDLPKNRIQLRHYQYRSLDEYLRSRGANRFTSDNVDNPWFNNTDAWHEANNWKSWLPGQAHTDKMIPLVKAKLRSRKFPKIPRLPDYGKI